jgi:hypothetical protein
MAQQALRLLPARPLRSRRRCDCRGSEYSMGRPAATLAAFHGSVPLVYGPSRAPQMIKRPLALSFKPNFNLIPAKCLILLVVT